MRPIDPFDAVIRRGTATTDATNTGQRLVAVDPRRGEIIHDTLWQRINPLRDAEYFLVGDSRDPRNVAEGSLTIPVRDFAASHTLSIVVRYSASCQPANTGRLIMSVVGAPRPGELFRANLIRWMSAFVGATQGEFIRDFFGRKAALETHLAQRALAEMGLTLSVVVAPEDNGATQPVVVELADLPLPLKDSDGGQHLTLRARLAVGETNSINAYLYRLSAQQWTAWLRDAALKYFAGYVTHDEFTRGLGAGPIRAAFAAYLDRGLVATGRRVERLTLEGRWRSVKELHEAHVDVSYRIQGLAEPVVIKSTVQMICRSRSTYLSSGEPPLDTWLEQNLREVVSLALFGKKYTDLLLKFKTLEREIKNKLSFRAAAIGYDVQQLITIPDLEPYDWLENFTIETEESFNAGQSNTPVRMRIIVTARLRQLQDVADYLNSRQNVPGKMEEAVLDEARQLMRTIDLARFYMRFDATNVEGEKPVAELLEEAVRNILTRKFKAEIGAVISHIVGTPYDGPFGDALKKIVPFSVLVSRPREQGSVTFHGDFQVRAIDPAYWERFQTMELDLAQIRVQAERNLLAELESFSLRALATEDVEGARAVKRHVGELIRNYVVQTYGLAVDVTNLRRAITRAGVGGDDYLKDVHAKELESSLRTEDVRIAELNKLRQHRVRLIAANASEREMKLNEDSIRRLEEDGANGPANPDAAPWPITGAFKPTSVTGGRTIAAGGEPPDGPRRES